MNILIYIRDIYLYLMWVLTLTIIYQFGYLQKFYFDILFLNIIVSLFSIHFVYIKNKINLKYGDINMEITGVNLIIGDLIFHQLPLVMHLMKGGEINKLYLFPILSIIYKVIVNDNKSRYGLNDTLIFMGITPILLIYLFYE